MADLDSLVDTISRSATAVRLDGQRTERSETPREEPKNTAVQAVAVTVVGNAQLSSHRMSEFGRPFDVGDFGESARQTLRSFLLGLFRDLGYSREQAVRKADEMTGQSGFRGISKIEQAAQEVGQGLAPPAVVDISLRIKAIELVAERTPPASLSVDALAAQVEFAKPDGDLVQAEPLIIAAAENDVPDPPAPATEGSPLDAWRSIQSSDPDQPFGDALASVFGADRVKGYPGNDVYVVRPDAVLPIDRVALRGAESPARKGDSTRAPTAEPGAAKPYDITT